MQVTNLLQSIRRRSLPVVARHLAFLALLHRGRCAEAHDAVSRILRLARLSTRYGNTWVALHLHAQREIVQRDASFTFRTIVQRQLQHVHSSMYLHTERHLARLQLIDRARARSELRAPRRVPARRAGIALVAHRGRSPATVSRLDLTTIRMLTVPMPRVDRPEANVRTEQHSVSPSLHRATASPVVLPADELSRVTEHVLRTFDRRVLSHRERTGQLWE